MRIDVYCINYVPINHVFLQIHLSANKSTYFLSLYQVERLLYYSMKRSSSHEEVNNNRGDDSLPASKKSKLKVDEESIETLMRDAGRAESRGAASLLYEKVGKIAESLKDAVIARETFLDIGLKFAIIAGKEARRRCTHSIL